jgi:peptide deformylase
MSLRSIHLLGSPALRQRSGEIAQVDDEVRRLIDDLFETMYAAKGVGLAANQIGVTRRVAVVDAEGQKYALVNPVILEAEGSDSAEEGCLSIPEYFGEVTRPARVLVEAVDREGAPIRLEADALLARAIQHEIDHLDGILFIDHLSPMKRRMLLTRWKKEHQDDPSYLREVRPASAGSI